VDDVDPVDDDGDDELLGLLDDEHPLAATASATVATPTAAMRFVVEVITIDPLV
jgi:hypothetical protein